MLHAGTTGLSAGICVFLPRVLLGCGQASITLSLILDGRSCRSEALPNGSPLRPRSGAGGKSDQLPVTKMRKRFDGVLAAVPTVFSSTERQTEQPPEVVVDEDHTDVDPARDAESTLGLACVDPREQAVLGRIGDLDGLFFRIERGHSHHWSKDLHLG